MAPIGTHMAEERMLDHQNTHSWIENEKPATTCVWTGTPRTIAERLGKSKKMDTREFADVLAAMLGKSRENVARKRLDERIRD